MGYKDYRSNQDGPFGYGISGGQGIEFDLFKNRVDGAFVQSSTTGSSQLTGTGNGTFLYDITPGFAVVDGKVLEINGAVDQACEAAGNILASGESKIYMFIAYKSVSGTVIRKTVEGAVAATASVAPPTPAEISAAVPVGCPWVCLGSMQINRTGDTTVTEDVDNQYRPMFLPKTVHD
jgi:hypothetical protein